MNPPLAGWAENFGFRQTMQVWRITALWSMIRGSGWGAMERKGLSG
jgi:hypothetical protein